MDVALLLFAKTRQKKNVRSHQLSSITSGCGTLTFETDSMRCFSHSLLHCGTLLPRRSSALSKKTRSSGPSTTSSAYKAQFTNCTTTPDLASIWKACPPKKMQVFLHSSFYRTGCGPAIDSSAEDGTTAPLVPSTDKLWKLRWDCRFTSHVSNEIAN
jgi:hypothetical protein